MASKAAYTYIIPLLCVYNKYYLWSTWTIYRTYVM